MTWPTLGFWAWWAFVCIMCVGPAWWCVRQRFLHRDEASRLQRVIRPPVYRFTQADESLPRNAAVRRALAQEKRIEAAQIESGHRHEDRRIQLVGRR